MENKRVVADTGIFIEYLRAKNKPNTALYKLSGGKEILVSAVTLYELYLGATDEHKAKDIRLLTDGLTILPFNKEIAVKAAEIYHMLKKANNIIEFRDIFIAATCLVYDLPIRTTNKKHFERVFGLQID